MYGIEKGSVMLGHMKNSNVPRAYVLLGFIGMHCHSERVIRWIRRYGDKHWPIV